MKKTKIRIGTRGSRLALYQAERTKGEINEVFPELETEIIVIKTKGDKILDTALSKIGDKGLFTKEIENALLDNTVDIAVHSLKDLATDIPAGLKLGAVLKRGEFRDALVHKKGKKLSELTGDDIIATSSLRRIAGLRRLNNSIQTIDIRGNVNTRLQKMENGHCDGMIMAAAGLQRLGLDEYITEIIEPDMLIPAVAQGAIAIESRENDPDIGQILESINHPSTMKAVIAERLFLNTLQGGCQVPVGCYSKIVENSFQMSGFVSSLNAEQFIRQSTEGRIEDANNIAINLARTIIDMGGKEILDQIRG